MDNKKLKLIVRDLLKNNPHNCRDHDLFLTYLVYQKYDASIGDKTVSQWFKIMHEQKLPPYDSILRCRRRLQQLYPELRGKRYVDRITVKQEEKKAQLGYRTSRSHATV